MKRVCFVIFALSFLFGVSAFAQTKCETIAEVKALASGTECLYEGTAVTTYYDGYNGIVMQDETGVILLKNSLCSYGKTDIVAPGMEVSNIKGKFVTGNNMIARIEVTNTNAKKIDVYDEDIAITPTSVAFDEIMKNPTAYEGVPVKLSNVNIRPIVGTTSGEIYSLTTDKALKLSFSNAPGTQLPLRADLIGFVSADYSGNIFQVANDKSVTAYAYETINNLKIGITEKTNIEYELTDSFVVTNIINTASNKVVYIQEETSRSNCGLRVILPTAVNVKIGDIITGLCGKFEPYVKGDNQKSATLTQSASKTITVIPSAVQPRILSNYIYTLTENNMQNAYLYDATLMSLSGGVITKSNNAYTYVIENENGQGRTSIAIKVANVDDLSAYVGKACPIQGVLDIAATYPENKLTLILRSTSDFLESNVQFETIADLIAAGEPAGTSVTYELVNPVLVTYKFTKGGGDNAVTSYYAIVQDATEGIVLSLGTTDLNNVVVGDSIVGLKGVYNNMRGMTTDILDVDDVLRETIRVKNSSNEIIPLEVTFAEMLANKSLFSNRVVVVENVKNNTIKKTNSDNSIWYDYYFTQDGVRLDYTLDTEGKPYFTFYNCMTITGVVDDRVIGGYYSVWPLSQNHIVNLGGDPTYMEDVKSNVSIFSNNKTIFIESEVGAEISVYSLLGQCLYSAKSVEDLTIVGDIQDEFVIVRVDDSVYKMTIVK